MLGYCRSILNFFFNESKNARSVVALRERDDDRSNSFYVGLGRGLCDSILVVLTVGLLFEHYIHYGNCLSVVQRC